MKARSLFSFATLILAGCSSSGSYIATHDVNGCELVYGQRIVDECGSNHYYDYRLQTLTEAAEKVGYILNHDIVGGTGAASDAYPMMAHSITITPKEGEFFASGQSEMSPQNVAKLQHFIEDYLRTLDTNHNVLVLGHTDAVGKESSNKSLSAKRARYVSDLIYTASRGKVSSWSYGMGESVPIAPNYTKEGQGQNRRIEIVDIFNNSESRNMDKEQLFAIIQFKQAQLVVNEKWKNLTDPTKVAKTQTKTKRKKVTYKDKNPLKLKGKLFKQDDAAHSIATYLGPYHADSWFNLMPTAVASNLDIESCPMIERPTQSDSNGKKGKVGNSFPALFSTSWNTMPQKGETVVVLRPVQVEKDFIASEDPTLSFITDYQPNKNTADYSYDMYVQTAPGDNALLYRIFPKDPEAPLVCADLIFRTTGENKTKYMAVYYKSQGQLYQKNLTLQLSL
ncbi:Outer membrane porin F precursor [Vibrio thalassae]|uniref:Outer membrane porin F n=1 Tax=Vibrio thalassae TaxID=1243014 RepID=A0A240EGV0_9VIBR|nr:OmpA family protein [Vibrio thalassae]SNX47741.1 Outer membrane porin F precursor [Vibrio thalassae]